MNELPRALTFPESDTRDISTNNGNVTAPPKTESQPHGLTPPPNFDSRYQSIALPSSFLFYPFKNLHMRLLSVRDQFALYAGQVKGSTRATVDVVSSCINSSAYDLTVGDFYYILYELRLRSYTRAPLTVTWTCTADKHLKMIDESQIDGMTLEQVSTVNRSDMIVSQISADRYVDIKAMEDRIFAEYGLRIEPVRVGSWVEATESLADESPEDRAVVTFFDKYALSLSAQHGSIKDRRELIVNSVPDLLSELDLYIDMVDHGVTEKFHVKCKECGTPETVTLSLDVPQFFPKAEPK